MPLRPRRAEWDRAAAAGNASSGGQRMPVGSRKPPSVRLVAGRASLARNRPGRSAPAGLAAGSEDLLWAGDAVPPARDRPKAVIDRDGRVAERLDLLQHGIGAPAREDVAGQEQQRQAI